MQRLADAARSQTIAIATPVVGETIAGTAQMLGSRWWENDFSKRKKSG
ncbi:MAG: hypothetical protein KKF12_17315 [Proteobacteria bacterium]|nr:hypothetical protein [Pseudomonadota bacterium]MBU4132578.1 hypothetical protein [Pseudomonadota bacterium]